MSHPAVDPEAVARLRQRLAPGGPDAPAGAAGGDGPAGEPSGSPGSAGSAGSAGAGGGGAGSAPPATAGQRARAAARRVATPVVARVRHELDRAAAGEVAALRAEVADLRAELARTRAEHAAAIAALQEDRRDPSSRGEA